ncbi:hypothetical protein RRG08_023292 [Elysia crispata]|uniref:Uncharacterized protein n=1 Tax=Elysia crispata TaxID=231223 RepID=A0AAE1BC54_9GAST|nr:hypothetical protein RRG08_023292 [Elysia crispata]
MNNQDYYLPWIYHQNPVHRGSTTRPTQTTICRESHNEQPGLLFTMDLPPESRSSWIYHQTNPDYDLSWIPSRLTQTTIYRESHNEQPGLLFTRDLPPDSRSSWIYHQTNPDLLASGRLAPADNSSRPVLASTEWSSARIDTRGPGKHSHGYVELSRTSN